MWIHFYSPLSEFHIDSQTRSPLFLLNPQNHHTGKKISLFVFFLWWYFTTMATRFIQDMFLCFRFCFCSVFFRTGRFSFPNSGSTTQNRWNKAYKISVGKTNATERTFESKQSLSLTQFPKSSSSVALKHFLPVAPHSSLLSPQHLILVTNCLTLSRSSLPHSYLVNQLSCKCI